MQPSLERSKMSQLPKKAATENTAFSNWRKELRPLFEWAREEDGRRETTRDVCATSISLCPAATNLFAPEISFPSVARAPFPPRCFRVRTWLVVMKRINMHSNQYPAMIVHGSRHLLGQGFPDTLPGPGRKSEHVEETLPL